MLQAIFVSINEYVIGLGYFTMPAPDYTISTIFIYNSGLSRISWNYFARLYFHDDILVVSCYEHGVENQRKLYYSDPELLDQLTQLLYRYELNDTSNH